MLAVLWGGLPAGEVRTDSLSEFLLIFEVELWKFTF